MTDSIQHLIQCGDDALTRLIATNPVIAKAYAFADAAHSAVGQTRDFTGEPYMVHPRQAAAILMTILTPEQATDPVAAMLMHDVLEDTDVTAEDMARHFDDYIVSLVEEVSSPDDPEYWASHGYDHRPNRKTRRLVEAERRAKISATAQTMSVADAIANSYNIVDVAPKDFALMYQQELLDRLDHMILADVRLRALARELLTSNIKRLETVDA